MKPQEGKVAVTQICAVRIKSALAFLVHRLVLCLPKYWHFPLVQCIDSALCVLHIAVQKLLWLHLCDCIACLQVNALIKTHETAKKKRIRGEKKMQLQQGLRGILSWVDKFIVRTNLHQIHCVVIVGMHPNRTIISFIVNLQWIGLMLSAIDKDHVDFSQLCRK